MYERFKISFPYAIIGMRYNLRSEVLTIGSFTKHRLLIEGLLEDYFGKRGPKFSLPQKNKVRFDLKIPCKTYTEGMKCMDENGIVYSSVNTLGNIFR